MGFFLNRQILEKVSGNKKYFFACFLGEWIFCKNG